MSESDLHEAARSGNLKSVKNLVKKKGCDPHAKGGYLGRTPLHWAAEYGHQLLVEYLIDSKECDPNCRDNLGWNPLHEACVGGHHDVMKYLIEEKECDPNCTTNLGLLPLHIACGRGHQSIVEYMIERKLCDPNCRSNDGWTPLHCACQNGHQTTVEYLFENAQCDPNCRNNAGETPLHIACREKHYQMLGYLLSMKCDPNIATNDGHTPLSFTSDVTVIRKFIKAGARAEITYRKYLPGSYSNEPVSSVVKTFIFGDPNAGKTTLTAAIKSESSGIVSTLSGRLFKVLKTNDRTTGIVPHHLESRQFGNVALYDFAGQREFYGSHAALLQSSVPGETAVYLIVVNLSKSNEEFRGTALYWLSFISNQRTFSKQHVIIVGSHADQVQSKEDKAQKRAVIDSLSSSGSFINFHFAGFVSVDCRYSQSDSMRKLRQYLKHSYEVLRSDSTLQMETHCFLVYLLEKNLNTPAITLGSLVAVMEREESEELVSYFSHDLGHLVAMCKELSARGNILFFSNPGNLVDSTIVLDQATLFSRVTGTIFAPESFKQHVTLASSTGVVSFIKLASQFPDLDSNIIAQFMCHMEFCHEVSDPEVLQFLQAGRIGTSADTFFFFPALVRIQVPGSVWEQADRFAYRCGWQLQCTQPEHFLTPRFLQVLILRLAFSFALAPYPAVAGRNGREVSIVEVPALQRRCTVWKNGIYWANGYGAEALVEMSSDSKMVITMIRCQKGYISAATKLRSGVIHEVLKAKEEFCSVVSCHESLLDSSSSLYPPSTSAIRVPVSAVAEAVVHAQPFIVLDSGTVQLQELLGFEPYANLGEALLKELFDDENQRYNEPLEDELIYRIARKAYPSVDLFIEMLALDHPDMLDNLTDQGRDGAIRRLATTIQLWRGDYRTICHLREKLGQFSIFAGRNPLAITQ